MLYRHWDNDSRSLRLTKGLGKSYFRAFQSFRRRHARIGAIGGYPHFISAIAMAKLFDELTQFVHLPSSSNFRLSTHRAHRRRDAKAATDGQGSLALTDSATCSVRCALSGGAQTRYQANHRL